VQRDVWQRDVEIDSDRESDKGRNECSANVNVAQEILSFLLGDEFMSLLSRIFAAPLTDMNVAEPSLNTNFFA
jgi:hypothetical protein